LQNDSKEIAKYIITLKVLSNAKYFLLSIGFQVLSSKEKVKTTNQISVENKIRSNHLEYKQDVDDSNTSTFDVFIITLFFWISKILKLKCQNKIVRFDLYYVFFMYIKNLLIHYEKIIYLLRFMTKASASFFICPLFFLKQPY
jgi:hypothetical protein